MRRSTEAVTKPGAALAIVCLAVLVVVIDNTILNVTLPTLARDLEIGTSHLQWIVDSYSVVFAGFVLIGGSIGDRLGHRRALSAGLAMFGLGSLGAAFADSFEALVACRVFTGLGSAVVFPATLAVITGSFKGAAREKAIGVWSAMAGIGVALGPAAGGWLVDHFWWGSVFLVNVPVVVLCMAGIRMVLADERPAPTRAGGDLVGGVLSVAGLGALVYGVIEAPSWGWTDVRTASTLGLAVALIALFVVWEQRAPSPMLELSAFQHPRFTAASASIAIGFFALFGGLFLLTQQLQGVLGYGPMRAGMATLPMAVTLLIVAPLSPQIAAKFGADRVLPAALAIMGVGAGIWALGASHSYWPTAAALVVLSVGIGVAMAPATAWIMESLPPEKAGIASGMNDATREVGGALGVAIAGSIASGVYRGGLDGLDPSMPGLDAIRGSVMAARAVADEATLAVVDRAFLDGVGTAMFVLAVAALAGAVLSRRLVARAA